MRMPREKKKAAITFALIALAFDPWAWSYAAPTDQELESVLSKSQWNDAAEISYEILKTNPRSSFAKTKGAYALFQKGYSNSALLFLKKLSVEDWKLLPQGQDRFNEIVALFQKKVPIPILPGRLEQLNSEGASPYLKEEIWFAKGRSAFERGDLSNATNFLSSISKDSKFYTQARYLLACIAVQKKDYPSAAAEFSKIFDPTVYQKSTEFWSDIETQFTAHWGVSLKVNLNANALSKTAGVAELAILGMGRVAYASKNFEGAIEHYSKLTKEAKLFSRAALEKSWALLALGRHDEAQKVAADITITGSSFDAVEARTVRALILADHGQSELARDEIRTFMNIYEASKNSLQEYLARGMPNGLPEFLKFDLKEDLRLQTLELYQKALQAEMDALRNEDPRLFPVYQTLASELEPLLIEAKSMTSKITTALVRKRLADLERLRIQAHLINAETYLDDREKLREEFQVLITPDAAKQLEHDKRLVSILTKAVEEVDLAMAKTSKQSRNLNLDLRQSELLWELSRARFIERQGAAAPVDRSSTTERQGAAAPVDRSSINVSQNSKDIKEQEAANALRLRSLSITKDIAENFPTYSRHAQAMFFMGFVLLELDRLEEGAKALRKYVSLYPKHEHIPDAYRILGDMSFDQNHFVEAEDAYKKILDFPDSPITGYAFYKIGWCAYNQKAYGKALLGLEKAILWAYQSAKSNQLLNLKNEAKHDIISVYAEVGDHRKAYDYFKQFFRSDSSNWLLELAKELSRTGQYEKSSDIYKALINLEPSISENLTYQASVMDGAFKLRKWPMVFQAAKELVTRYKEQLVFVQNEGTPAFFAEQIFRKVSLAQHFEYKKTDSLEGLETIESLDELYLSAFDQWPSSQEVLYEYAHFLFKRKAYPKAADAFKKHWEKFKLTLKEPLREEALRGLVSALESSESEDVLTYSSLYETQYPATKYTRAIAYLRPAYLLKNKRLDEGIVESQRMFDADSKDEFGKKSFQNLRVAYYQKKNWEAIYKWSVEMLSRGKTISNYAEDLKAIREESLFLWAENTVDDLQSAELYLKLANDPEMRRLKEKGYFNAFVRLQKSGDRVRALKVADDLQRSAPKSDGLNEASGIRAAFYQEAGDYERAYPLLKEFLEKNPKNATPEALKQAKQNLILIQEALDKKLSKSEKPKEFAAWPALLRMKEDFEKHPLGGGTDLAAQIKEGAARLEKVAKEFVSVSQNSEVPNFYAFEAYCTLPFLYRTYSQAVMALGKSDEELKKELSKVTSNIDLKVKELSTQCLAKGADVLHEGPIFSRALDEFGWKSDAKLREKVAQLSQRLSNGSPFFDQSVEKKQSNEIFELHLKNQGTAETWYTLAKQRWDENKPGLSRLTFIDALAKFPTKGAKFLNALAMIDSTLSAVQVVSYLERALKEGSLAAGRNLTLVHLKAGRLDKARAVLKQALDGGAFETDNDSKGAAIEFLKKE